jgi:DNA-binding FadR family transcriptional regulator
MHQIGTSPVQNRHEVIADAIKEKDLNKAQKAIEKHLTTDSNMVARAKKEYPQYFTK